MIVDNIKIDGNSILQQLTNNNIEIKPNGSGLVRLGWQVNPGVSINSVGEILASGDITAFSSDKRLKKNIEIIESPLEKIKQLSGFTYNWDTRNCKKAGFTSNDEKQIGVFAQDVQRVIPEAVKLAPFDIDEDGGSKSGDNYLTVQYDKIVPLLIESNKALLRRIEELEELVKNRINK